MTIADTLLCLLSPEIGELEAKHLLLDFVRESRRTPIEIEQAPVNGVGRGLRTTVHAHTDGRSLWQHTCSAVVVLPETITTGPLSPEGTSCPFCKESGTYRRLYVDARAA